MGKQPDEHIDWEDRTVMKMLFDRFYLPLRSFAFRYVGDDSITDDFVQTAFMNLWENRENFHLLSTVKAFLYTSVKNDCLNYVKRQQMMARHEEDIARELLEQESKDAEVEEEVSAMVYKALKVLSEQSRRIVLLTMEGASNAEIAEQLGITVNTVKTTKLRAYRVLREQLKGIPWP